MVEHLLAKEGVASSNLVFRSIFVPCVTSSPKHLDWRHSAYLFHHGYVTARDDIPRRADIDAPIPYRQNKHVLFGQQEGVCNGCRTEFPFRIFEVDHVIPQARGGTDHLDNLQLLCSSCNRIKGDRPMEYLMAQLAGMAR